GAVVEVQPDPVPSGSRRIEDLARPLVVEPGDAFDGVASRRVADRAAHGQLRAAVVVARLRLSRALAREAGVALQQRWRLRSKDELQRQRSVGNLRAID